MDTADTTIEVTLLKERKASKTGHVRFDDKSTQWVTMGLIKEMPSEDEQPEGDPGERLWFDESLAYIGKKADTDFTRRMYFYHQKKERIKPDGHTLGRPWHYQRTLDAFVEKQYPPGITLKEAAEKYDTTVSGLRDKMYNRGEIVPTGKRGREHVFDDDWIAALHKGDPDERLLLDTLDEDAGVTVAETSELQGIASSQIRRWINDHPTMVPIGKRKGGSAAYDPDLMQEVINQNTESE